VRHTPRRWQRGYREEQGSALLEFAIVLPILVVFVVGIFDFSGAFNQKQKVSQAAQLGAIAAGAQPTSDIDPSNADPVSLQQVVTVILNSLKDSGVLPLAGQGSCTAAAAATGSKPPSSMKWKYTVSGCSGSGDDVTISIDRGWVPPGAPQPVTIGTQVEVSFPYHWRFNSAIQLLVPGASYAAMTDIKETSTVDNQT
jgi:TadE-like protein